MIELTWLDHFPDNDLKASLNILDRLEWHIKISHVDKFWYVFSGEPLIFKTDSQEALDSFLYGLGLTYVCYDGKIVNVIEDEVRKLIGEDPIDRHKKG